MPYCPSIYVITGETAYDTYRNVLFATVRIDCDIPGDTFCGAPVFVFDLVSAGAPPNSDLVFQFRPPKLMCTEIGVYYKGECAHRKNKTGKNWGGAQKIGDIIRGSVHIEKMWEREVNH